ncbi:MAG: hypothetical protein ACR2FY_03455 [Pirellulaceae bacterium]
MVVVAVGWQWDEIWWSGAHMFLKACANQSPANQVMTLLLVDGAAVMALVALWAGWSRGWWFWRALLLVTVPASLAPLEANELILICLVSMPLLALAAWLARWRRDRSARNEELKPRTSQVSLANLFLAFVVLGLVAMVVRSVLVGHVILADPGLFWLAGSIAVMAVAAGWPAVTRGSGRRWLVGVPAGCLAVWVSWRWWNWSGDLLGLATYLRESRFPAMNDVYQLEAEICFLILVGLCCGLYSAAERYQANTPKGRLARAALALSILALLAPLLAVYPAVLPPHSNVTALPPSEAPETIMRAGVRIQRLEFENANRGKFLAAFFELDRALPRSGHVTHDPRQLARQRLSTTFLMDPKVSLSKELWLEMSRALHEGRDADALRLARLQWRVGKTFYLGGTLDDYHYGAGNQNFANWTVIALASQVSEQERRELLREVRALEQAEPALQTILDYDAYWQSVSVGWRDRLHDAAAWLTESESSRLRNSPTVDVGVGPRGQLRTLQYVLALELYRGEHGRFPQELSTVQAAFELPQLFDHYTDSAPIYRRNGDGYLLYSVGHDGQDDGGKFWTESKPIPRSENFDIDLVFDREFLAGPWRYEMKNSPLASGSAAPPNPQPAVAK